MAVLVNGLIPIYTLRGTLPRITGQVVAPITTGQIYWGAIPFVVIQLIMVGILIGFPELVLSGLDRGPKVDPNKIRIEAPPAMPNELPQFEFK